MVETVRTLISRSLSGERPVAQLSGLFALLALMLAAAGLYGVISCATARQTSEIGLRMALGASRTLVTRMVLQEALMLTLAGMAIGVCRPRGQRVSTLSSHYARNSQPSNSFRLVA